MKGRKRKRRPKQDSKPAEQIAIQNESDKPASPVETQLEIVSSASYVELQDEIENLANLVEMQGETESPADRAVISAEMERPPASSAAPATADRRTHPRYAFAASVEVVATEPASRMKTRMRDLSQQGCYVDADSPLPLGTAANLRATKSAKSFEARARVVSNQPGKGMGLMFTAVEAEHLGTLQEWIAESRETSWLAANRRRSQRVLMRIPVRVSGQVGAGPSFEEDAHTLAISAHGALIAVSAPMYRGQRLTLSNVQTKAALECVVAHIDRFQGQQIQVGIEFMLPNPTFWRVAFPPKDWTPRHPHAKPRPKTNESR